VDQCDQANACCHRLLITPCSDGRGWPGWCQPKGGTPAEPPNWQSLTQLNSARPCNPAQSCVACCLSGTNNPATLLLQQWEPAAKQHSASWLQLRNLVHVGPSVGPTLRGTLPFFDFAEVRTIPAASYLTPACYSPPSARLHATIPVACRCSSTRLPSHGSTARPDRIALSH
jgi:hypothetical protein